MSAEPYQLKPPAHPSPKPATSAPATSHMVRFRSPGLNNARTSSRLGLRKSHGYMLAGCVGAWLAAASSANPYFSKVFAWWNCMIGSPSGPPMITPGAKPNVNGESAAIRTIAGTNCVNQKGPSEHPFKNSRHRLIRLRDQHRDQRAYLAFEFIRANRRQRPRDRDGSGSSPT